MRRLIVIALFLAPACSENPVLGDWEIDPGENGRGAIRAAEVTDLDALTFRRDAIASEGTEIGVSYVVEEDQIRVVRDDGRGEHRVEFLADDKIRVELPIGVTAVYRKAGS